MATDLAGELRRVADECRVHGKLEVGDCRLCREASSLLEQAAAVVERLPVTADGYVVTNPHEILWRWTRHKKPRLERTTLYDRGFLKECALDCYRSQEAALAAQEPRP